MWFFIYLFILGLAIGSFLNVLSDRLANEQSLLGRSYCDHCRHQLRILDLIPVLSFFLLKGHCRFCHKKISWQYPLVELATGLLFVLTAITLSLNLGSQLFFYLGIISCLIVIFVVDLKYQIIPDQIQIALFIFIFSLKITTLIGDQFFAVLLKDIVYSFLVMLPLFLIYLLTSGRGIGFGDVKFAFLIGFLLGFRDGLLSLYLGFIIGAFFGIFLIFSGKKKLKSKIAFGPFLVMGVLILLYWGQILNKIINQFYGL